MLITKPLDVLTTRLVPTVRADDVTVTQDTNNTNMFHVSMTTHQCGEPELMTVANWVNPPSLQPQ